MRSTRVLRGFDEMLVRGGFASDVYDFQCVFDGFGMPAGFKIGDLPCKSDIFR